MFEFDSMWDDVHLDEKWFNADIDRRKVYLVNGQRRAAKTKEFFAKVMFLTVVARPRHDYERGFSFEGKIGMWPFDRYLPTLRNSRNRPIGALEATLVNVDAAVYREFMTTRVVPAIKALFPSANQRVVYQHDNPTPHRAITNEEVLASVSTDGWTFVERRQPPNSPDLNVLDLGFFCVDPVARYKMVSRSIDGVILSTLAAFQALSSEKIENVYLTLQIVMCLVIEHNVGNQFRLPHLKKDDLR
ncbi:hypothetical protein DYB32_010496, partial [Aphanomyces invadans]